MPIGALSGTDLALLGPQGAMYMGVFLSVVGLTLIAVGVIGSAVTMGRESSR